MFFETESYTAAFLVALFIFLIPAIFFLITQMKTLEVIDPQNRSMKPGEVWLQLIPFFGIVWQFFVVTRISESIQRQLNTAKFSFENGDESTMNISHEKPTYQIGLAYCILAVCSIIPVLGALAALGALVCWIIYWIKLADIKNKLEIQKLS